MLIAVFCILCVSAARVARAGMMSFNTTNYLTPTNPTLAGWPTNVPASTGAGRGVGAGLGLYSYNQVFRRFHCPVLRHLKHWCEDQPGAAS